MEWIKYTPLTPPPQGLKVLCFNEGDCWTAYSFNYEGKRIWVACVPHLMKEKIKKFTHHGVCDAPQYWAYIPFEQVPGDREYKGYMMVNPEGDVLINMDELELKYPKEHKEIVGIFSGLASV